MARTFTPVDACLVVEELVKEITGQAPQSSVDLSNFASNGETVLSYGTENVLNALSVVMGRTFMAVRPYEARLRIINALNTELYTNRMRKISFYSQNPQAAGDFNTDLFTNLNRGFDNGSNAGASVPSMWEQKPAIPLEMNFGGQSVWDEQLTIYENQLKVAFRDASEFAAFMNGAMTEKGNDIESEKEAYSNLVLLNKIGAVYDMQNDSPYSVFNVTEEFNKEFHTNYTTEELIKFHRTELLKFWVSSFKIISDRMARRSKNYHWSPNKVIDGINYSLLRHTPKDRQRVIMNAPFFAKAETDVMPEIFNTQYLRNPAQGEMVDFWQNINEPNGVKVYPAITNTSTGLQEKGALVDIPYVLAVLFDEDAMMVDFQYEDSLSSPVEARKRYRNIFWHFSKNSITDPTENCIIFIMKDTYDKVEVSGLAQSTDLWGTLVSEIQENNIAVANNKITGTLKYLSEGQLVTDWGAGYFLALDFTNIDASATKVLVGLEPSVSSGLVPLDGDHSGVFKITDKNTQKLVVKTEGPEGVMTQYFDLSALTLS